MLTAHRAIPGVLIAAVVLGSIAGFIHSPPLAASTFQESKSKTTRSKASRDEDDAEKLTGRLPAFYGQIGLDEEQRQEIYGLQAEYQPRIDELVEQLAEMKAELDEKTEEILTTTQKRKLSSLRASARSGSRKSDSDSESKPASSRSSRRKKAESSGKAKEEEEDDE